MHCITSLLINAPIGKHFNGRCPFVWYDNGFGIVSSSDNLCLG